MPSISRVLSLALLSTLAFSCSLSSVAADVNAINVKGNQMVDSVTGQRWMMKGVGYDYEVDDDHYDDWKPALDNLFSIVPDANTLRLYVIEPTNSYTKFIQYTQSKGIYNVVPLTGASGCGVLDRTGTPGLTDSPSCYPSCLLNWGQQVVNLFSGASNTLMFAVANEVIDSATHWAAAPCVKAFARDIKTYMNACSSMRQVPLLYTAADNAITGMTAEANDRAKLDYLTCTDPNDSSNNYQAIDVFGLNLFRWCTATCTFTTCGDDKVTAAMQGATVPLFLTEYGCNNFHLSDTDTTPAQRDWQETATLFGSNMNSLWSGGSAYTYGVRGDVTFSFFNDGSRDADGFPGTNKTCGYPNGQCNVDNYAKVLQQVSSTTIPLNPTTSSGPVTCPGGGAGQVNGFNLQPPPTRQGANGYTPVSCPSGSNTGSGNGNGNGGTTSGSNSGTGNSTSSGNGNTNTNGNTSGNKTPNGAVQVGLSAAALVGSVVVGLLQLL